MYSHANNSSTNKQTRKSNWVFCLRYGFRENDSEWSMEWSNDDLLINPTALCHALSCALCFPTVQYWRLHRRLPNKNSSVRMIWNSNLLELWLHDHHISVDVKWVKCVARKCKNAEQESRRRHVEAVIPNGFHLHLFTVFDVIFVKIQLKAISFHVFQCTGSC